ncbi:hypothetical protein KFL_004220030 [Klebsormidium nitens]|uniref:Intradiol ring-cleavage dioxygenases domain-containing protein n=1 Tax=Klebsormidium nitens TaxID=105231 RepID=A0A1Y1IBL9_KLENI|nr:hypothetical protein KFL_004220030 [Klebsormidium nitens]|eukprot:GAQ88364.1 hypothetical protein KFL_004220030 [Klebsormidium nitens]
MGTMTLPIVALSVLALLALVQCQPLSAPAPAPTATPTSCVLTPELTEGPYWLEDKLLRANITEGQAGIPFNLSIVVLDVTTCLPIPNVFVDIWHCNATGFYSGFGGSTTSSPGMGGGGPGGSSSSTNNQTFLRGITQTDANGVATFATIQPGWYAGRTPHIHVKVHIPTNTSTSVPAEYASSHTVHTGQLFFTDAHMALVSAVAPYTNDTNAYVALTSDGIYNSSPVELLNMTQVSATNIAAGLVATINAIVDTTANRPPTSSASNVATTSPSSTSATTAPSTSATTAPSTVAAATPTPTVAQSAPVSAVTSTSSAQAPGSAVPASSGSAMGAHPIDLTSATLLALVSFFAIACF